MVVLPHCTLVGKDCCTGEGRGAGKQSSSEDEADMGLTSGRSQQQTSKIKMTFELLVVNPNFQMRPASGGVGCADAINFAENFRSAKPVMQPAVCLAAAWHRCYGNLLGCVHHLDTVQLQVMSFPRPILRCRHELSFSLITIWRCLMASVKKIEVKKRHFTFYGCLLEQVVGFVIDDYVGMSHIAAKFWYDRIANSFSDPGWFTEKCWVYLGHRTKPKNIATICFNVLFFIVFPCFSVNTSGALMPNGH